MLADGLDVIFLANCFRRDRPFAFGNFDPTFVQFLNPQRFAATNRRHGAAEFGSADRRTLADRLFKPGEQFLHLLDSLRLAFDVDPVLACGDFDAEQILDEAQVLRFVGVKRLSQPRVVEMQGLTAHAQLWNGLPIIGATITQSCGMVKIMFG